MPPHVTASNSKNNLSLSPGPSIAICGCGNPLFGDAGFGPAVIAALRAHLSTDVSANIQLLDTPSAIRNALFEYVCSPELSPEHLILIDATPEGERQQGELLTLVTDTTQDDRPACTSHQSAALDMLAHGELTGPMKILLVILQIPPATDIIAEKLTLPVQDAIPRACCSVLDYIAAVSQKRY